MKKLIYNIIMFLILLIIFMLIKSETAKYISGISLVISILTFLTNMYYNGKAEEYKRISNTPFFCLIVLNTHMN